ncbi:MAG TPA: hypothetical protein VE242_02400 [Chthoniobacterales bacterium]|nr:hypothetical protein [Chthoniobacterales bacterium]
MTRAESIRNRASKVTGIIVLLAGLLFAAALCQGGHPASPASALAGMSGRIK